MKKNLTYGLRGLNLIPESAKIFKLCFIVLLPMLVLIFSSFQSSEPSIRELSGAIKTMKNSGNQTQIAEANYIEGLYYDIQPKVYLEANAITINGEGTPLVVQVDTKSLGMLNDNNPKYKEVKLLVVKIEDAAGLNKVINLSKLQGFSNLKYIVFDYSFELCSNDTDKKSCEEKIVSNMLESVFSIDLSVFYNISIPE